MALRLFDGFDTYAATADVLTRWVYGSSTVSLLVGGGRFGGNAMRLSGGNGAYFSRTAAAGQPTWVVGTSWRTASVTERVRDCIHLRDAGTTQVAFRVNTNGSVSAMRGGTALATTASALIAPNVWYYFELKATIHDTAGAYDLRVNGQSVLAATGVNTRATANNSANEVLFQDTGGGGSAASDFDDLYICDGTGLVQNDFLGECRVQLLRPVATGDASDFALPAGQTAYAAYRNAVLADNPLHFWELQETSGLSSPDTATGAPQAAAWTGVRAYAPGPYPGGSAADTANFSYAVAPYTADMNATGDVTLEAWVYVPAVTSQPRNVVGRGASGSMTYALQVDTGNLQIRWVQGNTGFNTTGVLAPVGRWFHLAGVRQLGIVSLYVDAVLSGTAAVSAVTPGSSTHPVFIGADANGAVPGNVANAWPGRIAYVAMYGAPLSAAQIRNHRAFSPFAAVDDQGLQGLTGDATYVQSAAGGATSVYHLQDPAPTTGTVHGVLVSVAAKKDDVGLRAVAPVVKSGAAEAEGPELYLGTDARVGVHLLTADPATGGPWTVGGVQGLQAGVRVTE